MEIWYDHYHHISSSIYQSRHTTERGTALFNTSPLAQGLVVVHRSRSTARRIWSKPMNSRGSTPAAACVLGARRRAGGLADATPYRGTTRTFRSQDGGSARQPGWTTCGSTTSVITLLQCFPNSLPPDCSQPIVNATLFFSFFQYRQVRQGHPVKKASADSFHSESRRTQPKPRFATTSPSNR